jgi:hypothetical protein
MLFSLKKTSRIDKTDTLIKNNLWSELLIKTKRDEKHDKTTQQIHRI